LGDNMHTRRNDESDEERRDILNQQRGEGWEGRNGAISHRDYRCGCTLITRMPREVELGACLRTAAASCQLAAPC
jgi:hypothetical protein